MYKKILSCIIAILTVCIINNLTNIKLLASSVIWDGKRSASFAGGSGTEQDPWQISNGKEFAFMAYLFKNSVLKEDINVGGHETFSSDYFAITNDIYLNDVSNFDSWSYKSPPDNQWLGFAGGYALNNGTIDGCGHTVYGAYMSGGEAIHIFPSLWGHGMIKNVRLEKCMVYGENRCGLLSSCGLGGKISNCYVSGRLFGVGLDEGIFGGISPMICRGGTIENCVFNGEIQAKSQCTGGIVGCIGEWWKDCDTEHVIKNCISYGTITGTGIIGGIAGCFENVVHSGTIDNCLSLMTIKGDSEIGGVVGRVGGLYDVINPRPDYSHIISNCISSSTITAESVKGNIFGSVLQEVNVNNCHYNSDINGIDAIGNDSVSATAGTSGLPTSQMTGNGAIANMKLDGNIWQDIDNYYPVIKSLHKNNWTVIKSIYSNNDKADSNDISTNTKTENQSTGTTDNSLGSTETSSIKTKIIDGKEVAVDENGSIIESTGTDSFGNTSKYKNNKNATDSTKKLNTKSKGKFLWIIIIICAIVVLAGGGSFYWFYIRKKIKAKNKSIDINENIEQVKSENENENSDLDDLS